MENVYVFSIASICIHVAFHQKYRRSHNETAVRHIWETDNRTVRWDLWSEQLTGKIDSPWKHLSVVSVEQVISLSHTKVYVFSISKKHCLPCDAWRIKRIKLITKIGGKALPHLGGTGKIPGGILHLRHHRDDGRSTDRSGTPAKQWLGQVFVEWFSTLIWCKITVVNSVTANAVHCHRRVV